MPNIMVIDEDCAMRTLITEWLTEGGHKVSSIGKLGAISDDAVRLVILDLPHLRARVHEIANALREVNEMYPNAQVIGISAQVRSSLAARSATVRSFGVERVLAKPCNREELLGAVAATL